ncbi:hypothetical protein DSECCO2_515360 [anaerobic digester metagenome]
MVHGLDAADQRLGIDGAGDAGVAEHPHAGLDAHAAHVVDEDGLLRELGDVDDGLGRLDDLGGGRRRQQYQDGVDLGIVDDHFQGLAVALGRGVAHHVDGVVQRSVGRQEFLEPLDGRVA